MITISNKQDCCGCTACFNICNHNAIIMENDEYGFSFPKVDVEKCVDCGLCNKVCPIQNEIKQFQPLSTLIAAAKEHVEQLSSSSGGIASILSRFIVVNMKGVVYGCSGEDCFNVKHIRVFTEDKLPLLKGSKYVQSDMSNIYRQIKCDLLDKRKVLFIGTPCQVAGLRLFLNKEYESLYCVDFVCHGVPSQQMLTNAITELSLKYVPISVAFREKYRHKSKYILKLSSESKVLYKKSYGDDCFITGYLKALFNRDSCYACKFAQQKRSGDITIGDYWDKDKVYESIPHSKDGLSQVHINTQKGESLLQMVSSRISCVTITMDRILSHSKQLKEPIFHHKNTSTFMTDYLQLGFEKSCRKALKDDWRSIKKQKIANLIFSVPFVQQLYFKIKNNHHVRG